MKKALVVGYFGYVTNQLDGQTVKTREIYNLLNKKEFLSCEFIDTQSYKYNKLSFIQTIYKIIKTKYLIYLPGKKNLLYLFYLLAVFSGTTIIYPIVGGWLSEYLTKYPFLKFLLKRIKILLSESIELKKQLENIHGFKNVEWFPNFRSGDFPSLSYRELNSNSFKIVYMGRIIKEKGIDEIFKLCKELNKQNDIKYTIDFYGSNQYSKFEQLLKESTNVYYKGELQNDKIHDTLKYYDLMLLPTYYDGEGFPGSIIDAYLVNMPVICSKWKFLPELVIHGVTGYVYDLNTPNKLLEYVIKISHSETLYNQLREGAYNMGMNFTEEKAWNILKKHINE